MKKTKKILAIILLTTMIFTVIGCSSNSDNKTVENDKKSGDISPDVDVSPSGENETVKRADTPDSLPDDLDFKGTVINIYHFGSQNTKDYDAGGEMSGDIVLDAVYQRNRKTEERLNIKLNWIEGPDDWDQFPAQVDKALKAGVNDYDLIMEENSRAFQHTLKGYFYNLMDVNYIDLNQPWWYSKMMEEGSINNNKRYYITGDATMTTLLGASAIFFNKGVFTNYFGDVSAIYDHVLKGTWTHDVLAEYCKGVYTDLNGNQTADDGDMFGFEYEQWGVPNYLSMSTGLTFSKRDENGLPVIDVYNEYGILWSETLYKLLYNDNISRLGDKNKSFLNGTNLFYIGQFGSANQLRVASFEYGILPYPKLNKNLDYMSAAATVNGNALAIPTVAPTEKFDATCAAIESLCAESYRNVVPTWYETALKIKYLDAEIDAQMVDIIYDHISSSFIMMADKEISIGSVFTYSMFGAKESGAFTSYWEKNEGSFLKKWDKMIEKYLELEN
jgi:hypothetical protein